MKKIRIILIYFGRLPALAEYFFMSCRLNPKVDFLLFADRKPYFDLPDNVRYIPMSRKEFINLAQGKLKISLQLPFPYKLCDYKPFYGHLFEDYLEGAGFWGYTDLDMIMGHYGEWLHPEYFDRYDIITARKDSFAGNFTLFKNTRTMRLLYTRSDNWKKILRNPYYVFSFPERFKAHGRPAGKGVAFRLKSLFYSSFCEAGKVNDLNDLVNSAFDLKVHYGDFMLSDEYFLQRGQLNYKVVFSNGVLTDEISGRKALYFHFYRAKKNSLYRIEKFREGTDIQQLCISPQGISFKH